MDRCESLYIWLHRALNGRNNVLAHLTRDYGTPNDIYKALDNDPEEMGRRKYINQATLKNLLASRDRAAMAAYFDRLNHLGITALCAESPGFPADLLMIASPPLVLYAKGRVDLLGGERRIAVIGRRKPEHYGREAARFISAGLARGGVTVVSGMAYGIDSCAHQAALDAGGDSIAVLGCGVDIAYPPDKQALYDALCKNGLVVSEYPPGTPPLSWHFPARNRIISGLSLGVVVVEAAAKSGTRITVDYALAQGRDIFAVPGNIFSTASEGTNELLQEGAVPIRNAQDILAYYGWQSGQPSSAARATPGIDFTEQEMLVLALFDADDLSFDELYEELDLSMAQLNAVLANLELRGVLSCLPGRRFAIKHGE